MSNPPPSNMRKGWFQDHLSNKEKEEIEDDLGLSGKLAGNDAYLLLEVPDFGDTAYAVAPHNTDAAPPSTTLTSFLRLGWFGNVDDEPETAKQLLKLIHQAGPPGNPARDVPASKWDFDPATDGFDDVPPLQTRSAADADAAGNRDVFFVDDVRVRPQDVAGETPNLVVADDPAHGLTMQQRQNESRKLYSRGGWRDHSDGNRISTTYGDKVEVVRGNYKMVVMGRQEDPGEAMGWEATGSHIQDYAPGTMPGASYWLEWIPNYQEKTDATSGTSLDGSKGVWLLANTTENVYEFARNAGHFREEKWGDLCEEYVGSANPSSGQGVSASEATASPPKGTKGHEPPVYLPGIKYHLPGSDEASRHVPSWDDDNEGMVRSNPHIVEKVWAERIDSWTGSSDWFIPAISEKKWANQIDEFTQCSGAITATTHAGAVNEREAIGAKASSTITSSVAETLFTAGVLSTTVILGLEVETKYVTAAVATTLVGGKQVETTIANKLTSTEICLQHNDYALFLKKKEVSLGATLTFNLGASQTFNIGKHEDTNVPEEENTDIKRLEKAIEKNEQAIQKNSTSVNNSWKVLKCNLKAGKLDLC